MAIYCTGDTHGYWGDFMIHNNCKIKPLKTRLDECEDNSTVIILGDFGFIFYPKLTNYKNLYTSERKKLKKIEKYCTKRNIEILFVDGNHENFNRINNDYETVDLYGGKAHKIKDHIFHLKRGEIFTIEGKKFLTVGGGVSIDKYRRITGVSYWDEELLSKNDEDNTIVSLDRHKWEVDYILTHTIHNDIMKRLDIVKYKYGNPFDKFFKMLSTGIEFNNWFFGHFHTNEKINDTYTCLYDKIININIGLEE